jgi:hypothetical protein
MNHEQTYGDERAKRLVALLRAMAHRINALRRDNELLAAGPEILKLMGDARSELFHYEVRCTYDTPEVARSRKIVAEAESMGFDPPRKFSLDLDDSEDVPWRE